MAGRNWGHSTAMHPADTFEAITKSDSVNLQHVTRAIYIGGAGDVAVVGEDNVAVTFVGLLVGTFAPIVCKRVNSTNTTATNLIGLT